VACPAPTVIAAADGRTDEQLEETLVRSAEFSRDGPIPPRQGLRYSRSTALFAFEQADVV
jgi:hypothetical protein